MKINPGGVQYIDCSSVTINASGPAVAVTDAIMADQFRNDKRKVIYGLNVINDGATLCCGGESEGWTDTDADDGKVIYVVAGYVTIKVTTNDSVVTFTVY